MNEKIDFSEMRWPEPSDWECDVFGMNGWMRVRPEKGKEPNWFWRQMQWLLVGSKWVWRPREKG